MPLLLSAQPCWPPTLIALNEPDGGVVRPLLLSPQQEIAPVLFKAQP